MASDFRSLDDDDEDDDEGSTGSDETLLPTVIADAGCPIDSLSFRMLLLAVVLSGEEHVAWKGVDVRMMRMTMKVTVLLLMMTCGMRDRDNERESDNS